LNWTNSCLQRLSNDRLAFIFPAFTSDYTDHPAQSVPGFGERFENFLQTAAGLEDIELLSFDFHSNNFLDDELKTQFITYAYSCTLSSLLREVKINPSISAGYSMGIYAALFDTGSVTFGGGLEMIRSAYRSLRSSLDGSYGMGTIIGLSDRDINQLIDKVAPGVQITNRNAAFSYVVSGSREGISCLLNAAKEEGALHIRNLQVSIPYHSVLLKYGAEEFTRRTKHIEIKTPETRILSLIDSSILSTPELIRDELYRNLFRPMNWFTAMETLMKTGITEFLECGPSTALAKNARFTEGIRFYPLTSIFPSPSATS